MRGLPAGLLLVLLSVTMPASAQTSTSFKLEEHTVNAGGRPDQGATAASVSFKISLDAVGDALIRRGLTGASFRMDAGFVSAYPPPGEVGQLVFTDNQTLAWSAEPSVGVYNLYRDLVANLGGLGYGNCEQQDLTSAGAVDAATPPPAATWFYLATAENRLGEEGTKGSDSTGAERLGTSCP